MYFDLSITLSLTEHSNQESMQQHPTYYKSSSDEEAPPQLTFEETSCTSQQNMNGDREHFIDNVSVEHGEDDQRVAFHTEDDIEDGLAKRNEWEEEAERNQVLKEQDAGTLRRSQLVKDVTDEEVDDAKTAAVVVACQNDMKSEVMKASHSDESGKKKTVSRQHADRESTSVIELQHEADSLSFTEKLAMTPPSLIAHTRLLAAPGAQRIGGGRNPSLGNSVISEQHDSPDESTSIRTDGTDDYLLYAESERMSNEFFVAELFTALRDRVLLVEGVRMDDLRKRDRILRTLVCLLIVVALIAVTATAGFITRGFSSSTSRSPRNPSNTTMGSNTHHGTPLGPSIPTDPDEVYVPIVSRLNETIADSLINTEYEGFTIMDTLAGQLFLETVNRTDTNFTFFSVGSMEKITEGIDPSIVGIYLSKSWIGHAVRMSVVCD